ncbi:MAG: DUF389 domain-containing protein [Rhodopirellula sp. JB044]|uniref:DUF389 domain-containing protein n=1 Tax=Rhodopirellula sp. JB044 TaxID=3342844 RepID=UPI003709D908
MNVTLLVGSQKQLSEGLPWLIRFAKSTGYSLGALVLGADHRALARMTEAELDDHGHRGTVELVEANVDTVVAKLTADRCRLLVMIDDVDDDRFQASLFERCGMKAVWLSVKSTPPDSDQHIFSIDDAFTETTNLISRRLLQTHSSLQLDHVWLDNEGEDSQAPVEPNLVDPNLVDPNLIEPNLIERAKCLERQRCDKGDLIWIPFGSSPSQERHYALARALLAESSNASIGLVSSKEGWDRSLLSRIRYWASHVAEPMNRDARLELANTLHEGSQPNLEFLGLISAAAMLAAFGLLQNSAAVIIGAMLIAPLMTPIMGAGLSLAHGNRPLFRMSWLTIGIGFLGAFVSSFLFGLLVRLFQEPVVTPEMWSRCNPSPLDFCVGLVGGMAASYARTRSHLSSALAGAAIAAALVPPIATAGLQTAFGEFESTDQGWPVFGPLILVGVNVLTIMIGTSFVLYARGLRIDTSVPSGTHNGSGKQTNNKWATRTTVSLVTLVLLVLVWMMHLERFLF